MAEKVKAVMLPITIIKADPDQRLVFGWASVVEKDGVAIIDKQGDVIPVAELENAAYEYMLSSRNGADMHQRKGVAKLVESIVFTKEKQQALGIDLGQVGWWVGFKVHDDELWAAHKRGERPELSIGGAAIPVEVDDKLAKADDPIDPNPTPLLSKLNEMVTAMVIADPSKTPEEHLFDLINTRRGRSRANHLNELSKGESPIMSNLDLNNYAISRSSTA
jgi:hypothetical protein